MYINGTTVRGAGGYNSIGRGVPGVLGVAGNAGIPGGAIIFWFSDARS
jgi:hypothetical protein